MKRGFIGIFGAILLTVLCACQKDTVTIVNGQREEIPTQTVETTVSARQMETPSTEATPGETAGEESGEEPSAQDEEEGVEQDYILNTSSKKFHLPTCGSVKQMKDSNKQTYHGTREALIAQGYDPCGNCRP